MRSIRFFTLFLAVLCIVAGCVSGGPATTRTGRTFHLGFEWDDFLVPEGVIWKVSWRTRYKPGTIVPGYDVRIVAGQAWLGRRGEVSAHAYNSEPGETGLLDLQVTAGKAVVWLDAGARFYLANEQIDACVEEFFGPK